MNAHSRIYVNEVEEQAAYRRAVRQIIDDIKRQHDLTFVDIAESIRVTVQTISNAHNEKSDLGQMYLKRLSDRYGAGFLAPYFALFGIQAAELEPRQEVDVLPVFTRVSAKIAQARAKDSLGGVKEVPQEKSAYLPDLKEALREGAHLVKEIEGALA